MKPFYDVFQRIHETIHSLPGGYKEGSAEYRVRMFVPSYANGPFIIAMKFNAIINIDVPTHDAIREFIRSSLQ